MGEFLMHAAIFAFAIPTAIVVIIVIILVAIILVAALLLVNRLRKSRRSISPGGSYQQFDVWGAKGPAPQRSATPLDMLNLPLQQQRAKDQSKPSTAGRKDNCPYCGAEPRPGDIFCLNCGNRLPLASPSPQQVQPFVDDSALPSSVGLSTSAQQLPTPVTHWNNPDPLTGASTSTAPVASASSAQQMMSEIGEPAHLILRTDNDEVLNVYVLNKFEMSIGRLPNSDVMLSTDKLTSRRHATIDYENGNYVLRDERSANGTFINGQQLEELSPHILHNGDRIGIGEHELVFQAYETASAGADIESKPTNTVKTFPQADITYRTREDVGLTSATSDDFSTRSMDGSEEALPNPLETPSVMAIPRTPDTGVAGSAISASVPKPSTPVYSPEQLQFTAFHPKEVTVETWNTLLVYALIEPAVEKIHRDAERFKTELSVAPRKISTPATQLLLRETNITIVPECKGVVFNPKRFTFKWLEDWHRANFRFLAKQELSGSAGNGRINIFAGPLLVGTLKLALLFEEQDALLPAKDRNTQVTESLYKQIFASYSHDDSLIVITCRNVYKALGFNILIDIDTLRSGQLFSDTLMRMIDAADIFQLFWSERSAKSAYVAQEWEYALRLNKGEGFVRPVYWEIPMAKPPEKLAQLHFAYLPAYTFTQPSHPRQEA